MLRPPVSLIVLLACLAPSLLYAWELADTERLCGKMEEAYGQTNDYQTEVAIRTFHNGHPSDTRKFRYSFKKPKWVRLDFESPHPGMIIVYPDDRGEAVVRRRFTFHLDPHGFLLRDASGQTIDQTDFGVLIRNIRRSLTDQARGPVEAVQDEDLLQVRVLAENHFRPDVLTRYAFFIHTNLWLPARVEESTPEGSLQRTIGFSDLRINVGLPESYFRLNGE